MVPGDVGQGIPFKEEGLRLEQLALPQIKSIKIFPFDSKSKILKEKGPL